ncbi:sigma-70 family RNA polymerase sigma factor [Botrimarina mediterranea]|uniref:RNA polymerase sigma factor CnrH n=1 Tax=Botrimarina mediterranea TaxID=2528022 RepID=A0A518K2D2_9BACT|nr:sigma-70 family RNA polymerase sigma factor [Botrimarina mediterranea]QDV71932.1 RNA polymerase sigma factor CnrH [Botrimarina mediterranea]QDV76473.1 RNA polymerase sigma factor CnrH [Planctomycetes bacterium K2D]
MNQDPGEGRLQNSDPPNRGDFVQLLTKAQLGLLRYITTLVGNPEAASNILQNTNLLLWQKADEFEPGTNFDAWATTVAYWQVRAYGRDRKRDRHIFSDELVVQLADETDEGRDMDVTISLLRSCLQSLGDSSRELISMRYNLGLSIQQLSSRLDKSPSAVKGALLRARRALRQCIESKRLQAK